MENKEEITILHNIEEHQQLINKVLETQSKIKFKIAPEYDPKPRELQGLKDFEKTSTIFDNETDIDEMMPVEMDPFYND